MKLLGLKGIQKICEALRVDPKDVYRLNLEMAYDAATTLTVERYVTVEDGEALATELKRYVLVELEPVAPEVEASE